METLDIELLISVAGGLGSWREDEYSAPVYTKGEDCSECLKDLQRFLRQDDPETRPAFMALCKFGVARSDLVPLILSCPEDVDTVYNALKVVTFLTMPMEKESDNKAFQVEQMQAIKEAFLAQDALAVVTALVAEPLARHPRMTQQDALLVQLVITFLRNLLAIPDQLASAGSSRGDHRTKLRQDMLARLFEDHVMELLLTMAQHANQAPLRSEAPLLLEIFHCILTTIDIKDLMTASAATPPHCSAQQPSMHRPDAQRQEQQRRAPLAPARPQGRPPSMRYAGTFVKRSQASASDASVLIGSAKTLALPPVPYAAKAKGRPVQEEKLTRLSGSLLSHMRGFAESLLFSGAYGQLMSTIRKDLEPGIGISRLSRESFVHFLALARACTCFLRMQQEELVRAKRAGSKQGSNAEQQQQQQQQSPFMGIAATMGWETFHMVQVLWLGIIDLPVNAPEKDWDLQHVALGLMKELLFVLDLAQHAGNDADRLAAGRLQRRLLQDDQKDSGLLPVLARLVKGFSSRHQPRSHAGDLVESIHVVLRMLDRICLQEAGGFLVKRKIRPQIRRKAAAAAADASADADAAVDQGGAEGAAQDADGPNADAQLQQQQHSGTKNESPGSKGLEGRPQEVTREAVDPFDEMEQEEEREAARKRTKEVSYNMRERVRQELAVPSVVHFYTWLLRSYAANSNFLNHCIVAFLKRLSRPDSLNLEPMLYQLSVLRLFQQILADAALRKQPAAAEMLHFAAQVTRSLFARLVPSADPQSASTPTEAEPAAEGQAGDSAAAAAGAQAQQRRRKETVAKQGAASLLFLELLFWKPAGLAAEIREEYNWRRMYESRSARRGQKGRAAPHAPGAGADWDENDSDDDNDLRGLRSGLQAEPKRRRTNFSTTQQEQLVALFEQHAISGKGYMDAIKEGLGSNFSIGQIRRELKAMGLKRGQPTERQAKQLRELFEQYSMRQGYLNILADKMGPQWKKSNVSAHLKRLGLSQGKRTQTHGAASEDSAAPSPDKAAHASKVGGQDGNRLHGLRHSSSDGSSSSDSASDDSSGSSSADEDAPAHLPSAHGQNAAPTSRAAAAPSPSLQAHTPRSDSSGSSSARESEGHADAGPQRARPHAQAGQQDRNAQPEQRASSSDSEDERPHHQPPRQAPSHSPPPSAAHDAQPQQHTGAGRRWQPVPAERSRQRKAPRTPAGQARSAAGRRKPAGQSRGVDGAQRLALAALTAKRMRAQAGPSVAEEDDDDEEVLPYAHPGEQPAEPRPAGAAPQRKRLAKRGAPQQPAAPDPDDMLVDLEDY